MARPQMESGVDHHSRGTQHSCRMEVQRPDAWPGGSMHHQIAHPTYQRYPNMNHEPSQDHAPNLPGRDAPLSPNAHPEETPRRESTDPEREHQDTTDQDPLPDLLPQRERSPRASPQPRGPRRVDPWLEDEVVERIAHQLRRIGDDLNATTLQRVRQDWRGLYLGVLNFLSDTLSTLYRLI
ncbi:hypothetical protein DPEC_G00242190 [Dallia pectoralis]|uniref:Uncharacterized protein n=1 Tax=Dallia pectoralis TaxID=75939 RepID=A0ACC2FV69_DALPE|nr:hypothetical protein DPEC_G00242190 [Dallia pectoralis]